MFDIDFTDLVSKGDISEKVFMLFYFFKIMFPSILTDTGQVH